MPFCVLFLVEIDFRSSLWCAFDEHLCVYLLHETISSGKREEDWPKKKGKLKIDCMVGAWNICNKFASLYIREGDDIWMWNELIWVGPLKIMKPAPQKWCRADFMVIEDDSVAV